MRHHLEIHPHGIEITKWMLAKLGTGSSNTEIKFSFLNPDPCGIKIGISSKSLFNCYKMHTFFLSAKNQWWIQDFTERVANPRGRVPTYYMANFWAENCMKIKESVPRGGAAHPWCSSLDPPLKTAFVRVQTKSKVFPFIYHTQLNWLIR